MTNRNPDALTQERPLPFVGAAPSFCGSCPFFLWERPPAAKKFKNRGRRPLLLALAFGSAASGELRPDSDVDVAVLLREPMTAARRRALIAAIAEVAGRPVDLVDLRTSGVAVTQAALAGGKRLVCKDRSAFAALLSRTLFDAADFLPYRRRILTERRERWTR